MYCPNCKIDYLEATTCSICGTKLQANWSFLTMAKPEELEILLEILESENIPYITQEKEEETKILVPENYYHKATLVISYDDPNRFNWIKTVAYLALLTLILGIIL